MSRKDFESTPKSANVTYGAEQHYPEPATHLPRAGYLAGPIAAATAPSPIAVLVCHGMGQQVRFETVGQLAASILNEARRQGCTIETNGVQLSLQDDEFLTRAELNWTDRDQQSHQVHIYEAYWAPVTEGKVTYYDTIKFLVNAGLLGLRRSIFRWKAASFQRWMFGVMQDLRINPFTWLAVLLMLLLVSAEIVTIAFITLRIATGIKEVAAQTWPVFPGFWSTLGHWFLQVLRPFIPAHHILAHSPVSSPEWRIAAWHTLLWFALVAQTFFIRYFLVQYVGDVAAYISPYKDSKFDSIRTQIQAIGLNVAKVIYGFNGIAAVPEYERIVIAGHSLGSVLAYDTLNAIIKCDEASASPESRRVVKRTTHLITFGSPLDKTAFLFRNQSNHIHDPLREQMAAACQPLILNKQYRQYLTWINLWSPWDVVSGSLDYYDATNLPESDPLHVQNEKDPAAWVPFYAHVQYWTGRRLAQHLFNAVK